MAEDKKKSMLRRTDDKQDKYANQNIARDI
jgi:hypothetical protein